ncbi:MAG: hypothetical protein Q9208_000244 [Pyrenodesmia sp. 3 TL-2023]
MPTDREPYQNQAFYPSPYRYDDYHEIKMQRPQDVYFDYNARQQHLRERARAPSRRPRKRWPPLPSAEDEMVSLAREFRPGPPDAGGEEARSRGSLDQQPLILDVDLPSTKNDSQIRKETGVKHRNRSASEDSISSDESSGPETPTDSGSGDERRNQDRRYVFIPQEGVEIPLTYDEPRTPIHAKPSESYSRAAPERGRRDVPKLDTDLPGANSTYDVPVQLERERSPYQSTPKTKETRFPGEYLLSHEMMSPKTRRPESPSRYHSKQPQRASSMNPGSVAELNDRRPTRAARPSTVRHASAMAFPGETTAALSSPTQFGSNTASRNAFPPVDKTSLRFDSDLPETPRRSSALQPEHDRQQELPSKQHPRKENIPSNRAPSTVTGRAPLATGPLPLSVAHHSLNAALSSPLFDRRQASPRNSPRSSPVASATSSPMSSPPRTPPAEAGNRKVNYIDSVRTSSLNSKLHPSHASKPVDHLNAQGEGATGSRPAIRSRQTSPLPSAIHNSLEPDLNPRVDVRSPSPSRRRRSSTYGGNDQRSRSQHPSEHQTQEISEKKSQTLIPVGLEHRCRSSSAVGNRPRLTIDSSHAQETTDLSQPRHLSVKSPSATRAASVGAPPATLPPCPRSVPVGGHNDWYSLHDYPTFKICPSCREAVSRAGYGRHFVAAFSKSPERPVQCSFSIPWIRMAYLLMVKKRRSDANLLYDMADIAEDTAPCPGKRPSAREWYRILDVDSDRSVPGFYACPYCIRSLEAIFPVLKGVFYKSRSRRSLEEQACSLRSDSSRFATYVDLLEDTANQANEYRRAPNTYRFVELAKKLGAIPSCVRDDMLRGRAWHIIPRLPEFTACGECYEDIIWPAVLRGLPLASQFTKEPQVIAKPHVGISCQIYSSKMRNCFLEACSDDDFDYLRKVALKRHSMERDLQKRIVEAQRLPRDERETAMEDIVDEWQEWDE